MYGEKQSGALAPLAWLDLAMATGNYVYVRVCIWKCDEPYKSQERLKNLIFFSLACDRCRRILALMMKESKLLGSKEVQ